MDGSSLPPSAPKRLTLCLRRFGATHAALRTKTVDQGGQSRWAQSICCHSIADFRRDFSSDLQKPLFAKRSTPLEASCQDASFEPLMSTFGQEAATRRPVARPDARAQPSTTAAGRAPDFRAADSLRCNTTTGRVPPPARVVSAQRGASAFFRLRRRSGPSPKLRLACRTVRSIAARARRCALSCISLTASRGGGARTSRLTTHSA